MANSRTFWLIGSRSEQKWRRRRQFLRVMLNFISGMEEKRDLYFAVLNKNPVALTLKDWGANLTGCLLELMGLEKGGVAEVLAREGNYTGMSRPSERHPLRIPPGHYMVFR